jgi:hypothetical protein
MSAVARLAVGHTQAELVAMPVATKHGMRKWRAISAATFPCRAASL